MLESAIETLNDRSAYWEGIVSWFTAAVVVGVVIDIVVVVDEYLSDLREWRHNSLRHSLGIPISPSGPSRRILWTGLIATILIILGVAGEWRIGIRISQINGELRDRNSRVRNYSDQLVAIANQRANEATAEAKSAELELARLTGPPFMIPVISAIAKPDLSKSVKQIVILTRDTRIDLPVLSKGESLSWTLIIKQDSVGEHQFTFSPSLSEFSNRLNSPPYSSWDLNLYTDPGGTRTVGLASFTPASDH